MTHIVGVCVPPTRASFREHPSHRRHRHGHRVAAWLRSGRGVAAADRGSARASAACLTKWWATCRPRSPASSPIAARIRPRDSTPTASCRPKTSGRWIASSRWRWPRRRKRWRRRAGRRDDPAALERTATIIGSGIGGIPGDRGCGAHHRHARPTAPVAVHGAVVPHQPGGGPRVDPARLQGTDRRTGDGVRGGRAGDRRRGAADPSRAKPMSRSAAAPNRRFTASASAASPRPARSRPASTTRPNARRGRSTTPATAS